ncbi:MAG: DNA translocase FtsK 4TM domain-containing protein [Gammaproteobacteria bacterium]|nr:DNA translocase FtsK 4TM domain-containing protein [Gammaproteobacteria bacterium]
MNHSANKLQRGLREAALILLGALSVYLFVALVTYNINDPAWSHSSQQRHISNAGGVLGAWFSDVVFFLFGYFAYLLPLMVATIGWQLFHFSADDKAQEARSNATHSALKTIGLIFTVGAGTGLLALQWQVSIDYLPANSGGVIGGLIAQNLSALVSPIGANLFLAALFLTGLSLFSGLSWVRLIVRTGQLFAARFESMQHARQERKAAKQAKAERKELVIKETRRIEKRKPPKIAPSKPLTPITVTVREKKEKQIPLFDTPAADMGLPALGLLDEPVEHEHKVAPAVLEAMARQVELKLRDFGIQAEVTEVFPGPVITRFELMPAPGVKGSQIANLSKDLARSLSVISVRVVDVIPGKSVIGLEIPNENREIVRLVEIIRSKKYEDAASPLTLALGKDIGGNSVIADLAKMPHLLVAGTTGSGKSVAINAMVLSLLYNATPDQVRLIMIDPKMLELSIYDDIPHLLTPVVTDMKEAASALRWCVGEMERRYKLMASLGVRNITGCNRKINEAIARKEPILDPLYNPDSFEPQETLEALPYVVVIIDELADMMMVVGKKVEELIARLAQKARAAGIHLILATQRPSVDVLTGLIKANIPTRIAFQVSSKIDSRTVIDQSGAEQLLGHGDMLFMPPGTSIPNRVHGAFVDDHEVHNVVADLKKRGKPDYNEDITAERSGEPIPGLKGEIDDDAESDPLYDQAVEMVCESRKASISSIQRRLKIGYNRAARMVEAMEAAGVVSAVQSNGQREVLAPPSVVS